MLARFAHLSGLGGGGGRPFFFTAWALGSRLLGMRCMYRRRPRLGMGWLRAVLSPLRRLWCRANAVQRKSTSPMAAMTRAVFLRFSEPCWYLMHGEFFFFLLVWCVQREASTSCTTTSSRANARTCTCSGRFSWSNPFSEAVALRRLSP